MYKRLLAAALVSLSAVLCACSSPLQTNIEELLQPPQLSEEQTAVYDALRDHVGQSLKLKYPASGDYRSAFIFRDLDADAQDEAIVLYSVQDSASAWISILDRENGVWRVDNLLPGAGSDVDFLRFESLTKSGGENIIVGWNTETASEKQLAIYGLGDGGIEQLFDGSYAQVAIQDFSGDELSEIVLIVPSRSRPAVRLVAAEGNEIAVRSTVYLSSRISAFTAPKAGGIIGNISGIFIDCYTENDALCTAVIQIAGHKLTILIGNDDETVAAAARTEAVYCADVDGDGIIEIPRQTPAPGYSENGEETLYITEYARYSPESADKLKAAERAYVNVASGYRFVFPERWSEASVSLYRQRETGETIFFLYSGDIYDHSGELIRIRVNQMQDYQDKFDTQKYFIIGNRGTFEYYGYIAEGGDGALAVTQTELKEHFTLIG